MTKCITVTPLILPDGEIRSFIVLNNGTTFNRIYDLHYSTIIGTDNVTENMLNSLQLSTLSICPACGNILHLTNTSRKFCVNINCSGRITTLKQRRLEILTALDCQKYISLFDNLFTIHDNTNTDIITLKNILKSMPIHLFFSLLMLSDIYPEELQNIQNLKTIDFLNTGKLTNLFNVTQEDTHVNAICLSIAYINKTFITSLSV